MSSILKIIHFGLPGIILIGFSVTLYAQEMKYAGPDRSICFGSSTPIGSVALSEACYAWSSIPEGFTSSISNPIVAPTVTTTYKVSVVGKNFQFAYEDYVIVTVVDEIIGFEIIPYKCCWKVGDPISRLQFDIRTNPTGLQDEIDNVVIIPSIAPSIGGFPPKPVDEKNIQFQITFNCNGNQQTLTTYVPITVVDEEFQISQSLGIECEYGKKCDFQPIKDLLQGIANIFNFIPGTEVDLTAGAEGSTKFSMICCPLSQGGIKTVNTVSGSVNSALTIEGKVPIPPIAPVMGKFMCSVGLEASVSYQTTCKNNQLCFEIQPTVSSGGGVSLGDKKVLEVSIMFIATFELPTIKLCLPPVEIEVPGDYCLSAEFVGEVTFKSFLSQSINVTLINRYCRKLW